MAGRQEEALQSFMLALKTHYDKPRVYNNMGLALAGLGRMDEALGCFEKAGGEARAFNNLGWVYLQKGEREKAQTCFDEAVALEPVFYDLADSNKEKAGLKVVE
jgi:Flp pilus assembly protein TadD